MKKYSIAIVGATGLVGSTFIEVIQEYKIEVENLYLYASARSEGKIINYLGKDYVVQDGDIVHFRFAVQSKFKLYQDKKTENVVLYNQEDDIMIDEYTYLVIVDVLRKMHGLQRNNQIPGNESTKKILILIYSMCLNTWYNVFITELIYYIEDIELGSAA